MAKVTIQDVARSAGVSVGTVSAVLNNYEHVREATRLKVQSAVSRLNYTPNGAARELRLQQQGAPPGALRIGMLVKEFDNPFYAEVILGARRLVNEQGGALFLTSSEGAHEEEHRLIDLFRESRLNGMIIAPLLGERADFGRLFELQREQFPFVLLGEVRGLPVSMVTVDNLQASRDAVQYLIRNGHTRIVHFAGPAYSAQSWYRAQGFMRGFSESHLVFEEQFILPAGDHLEDGYRAALAYFKGRPPDERPTAVTCFNDLVAFGVMRALHEIGLPVPEAVSVIGYDDIEFAKYQRPPLTTVRTPSGEMGRIAAELLLRQIQDPQHTEPEKRVVPASFVLRSSTRPLH